MHLHITLTVYNTTLHSKNETTLARWRWGHFLFGVDRYFRGQSFKLVLADHADLLEVLDFLLTERHTHRLQYLFEKVITPVENTMGKQYKTIVKS